MTSDGKQIIENVTRQALSDAARVAEPAPAVEKKTPAGCVERTLNMRDRNAVIGACVSYTQKEGHKSLKDQTKLDRLKKLLLWDETLEYYAMTDESLDDERRTWRRAKSQYKLWRDYKEGTVKAETVLAQYPDLDLSVGPPKPQIREPELKPDERRGPETTFYLLSKLDSWVQDALRAMDWPINMEELSVEVCAKFGIKDDDLG